MGNRTTKKHYPNGQTSTPSKKRQSRKRPQDKLFTKKEMKNINKLFEQALRPDSDKK